MTRRARRAALVVLDGVGIGEAPDAAAYGDAGSDTLGNVARTVGGLELPFLDSLGLGCCRPLEGMRCEAPTAAHGVAVPRSAGKDSTAGHWEICGVLLERPFPTFPGGFPDEVLEAFSAATGRGVLGNKSASGTAIIEEYGREHREGGDWILYTSVDSVFQIAAHEEVVPLEELYTACRVAREEVLVGAYALSRVIARPFVGEPGHYRRTANRRDFSLPPPGDSLLDRLAGAGIPRAGVGKVDDLFAGNVIEFDQEWGHRNDVAGFHRGLVELDGALPELVARLEDEDLLILTADHGNDPTTPSTDHSREVVPVLAVGPRVRPVPLGTRSTFADVGATVAEYLGVELDVGTSFLSQVIS
jgi:phosphopentomutase